MTNKVLQELSRWSINITKFEDVFLSWHESYITLLTEKGVHIFELSHNIGCFDKKIDCIQTFIRHPKYSPAEKLFTDKIVNKDMRNLDMTEMVVDHALWPHNSQLMTEMSCIIDFKWSPVGAVNNHDSAIAVLTNVGVVEIYVQQIHNWECALQISKLLSKQCMTNARPDNFRSLKEMVYTVATTAICWSPILNKDNSAYFITAQKNGNIILWNIERSEGNTTAGIKGTINSGFCEIISMLWINKHDGHFFLVCSNVIGQIIVLLCSIQDDSLHLVKSEIIWPDKDRMIPKFLQYIKINNNIVLACNKHRHLLVLMFDNDCNLLGHYLNNINDYRISSITKACDGIYVSTINSKIFKLDLSMCGEVLNMNLDSIEYQCVSVINELHSISHSPNKILTALCAVDRKLNCRKEPIKVELIFASSKETLDSLLDVLLLNPTKSLCNYWDVIEVLRYKTMKTKVPPQVDYESVYESACSDIYMLKVYLILSSLCKLLMSIYKLGLDFNLPEDSIESVKEEILVAHADKLIHKYYEKHLKEGELNSSEIEYFLSAKKFLDYFFSKNKKNLQEVIEPHILSIVDKDKERPYTCQWCDAQVTGFKCENDHLNMFCALTFTPIESNSYLLCKWCNLTAKKELYTESPFCLFCDVNLKLVT